MSELLPEPLPPALRKRLRSEVRLIALDLDGTTLDPHKRLTPYTAQVLRRVRESGRQLCFATGRMLIATAPHAEACGFDLPQVVLNGSLVARGTGEPLFAAPLPRAVVERSLVRPPEACSLYWLTRDELLTEARWDERTVYLHTWTQGAGHRVSADLGREEAPVYQLHWVGEESALRAEAGRWERPGLQTALFQSSRGPLFHLEVRVAGVDKAAGVGLILGELGLEPGELLAIGDWLNDLELVEHAGWGLAMGNASPELRAVARGTLPLGNDQDGVARFLEDAFLAS